MTLLAQSNCFSWFWDSQKAANKISLKEFQKANTIRGKIILDEETNQYEVEYALRIREPQFKTTKMMVSTVDIEKFFPRVDINAKIPVTRSFVMNLTLLKSGA